MNNENFINHLLGISKLPRDAMKELQLLISSSEQNRKALTNKLHQIVEKDCCPIHIAQKGKNKYLLTFATKQGKDKFINTIPNDIHVFIAKEEKVYSYWASTNSMDFNSVIVAIENSINQSIISWCVEIINDTATGTIFFKTSRKLEKGIQIFAGRFKVIYGPDFKIIKKGNVIPPSPAKEYLEKIIEDNNQEHNAKNTIHTPQTPQVKSSTLIKDDAEVITPASTLNSVVTEPLVSSKISKQNEKLNKPTLLRNKTSESSNIINQLASNFDEDNQIQAPKPKNIETEASKSINSKVITQVYNKTPKTVVPVKKLHNTEPIIAPENHKSLPINKTASKGSPKLNTLSIPKEINKIKPLSAKSSNSMSNETTNLKKTVQLA